MSNVPVIKDAYINGRKDTDVSTCIVYVTSQGKLGVDCGASILAGTADTLPADDSKDGEDDPANGADADEKDHTAPHTDDISYAGLWIGLMGVGILSLIVPALTGKRSARKTTGERFHD